MGLGPKVTLGVLAFLLSVCTAAYADTAPLPVNGSASLIPAPNPNPVNYNFTAGTVISSAQVNTNNYKMYSDMMALTSKMNATTSLSTSYTCPYCITQVLNGAGVVSTISGPTANGQSLSIVLGVVPIGNGGTGTANPSGLIAGSNITVTGSFPNQTVSQTTAFPVFNSDGTVATSKHYVFGICPQNASQDCVVSLFGAAAFSNTLYWCGAIYGSANANEAYTYQVVNMFTTGFTLHNTLGPASYTRNIPYFCFGS